MNARNELLEISKSYKLDILSWNIKITLDNGIYVESLLQQNYTEEEFLRELNLLNVEYNGGFGSQNLFGCVLLEDNYWLSRQEYDGAEGWELNHAPDMRLFESKKYTANNSYIDTLYMILSEEERFHELHITIRSINDVDKFKMECKEINVKPIILALQTSRSVLQDVMTSYTKKCTYSEMQHTYHQQYSYFKEKGYDIVRFKIETTEDVNTLIYSGGYFESHIHLHIEKDFNMCKLQQVCKELGVHLSKNTFKEYEDYSLVMATLRMHDKLSVFKNKLNHVVEELSKIVKIGEHHIEYAIHDSNVKHDCEWIGS